MKKISIILIACLALLCVIGWVGVINSSSTSDTLYSDYIKQGDVWVEEGLYQRAIKQYELALEYEQPLSLYTKMDKAYALRYEEAPEDTLEDYMDFLKDAVAAYPTDSNLVLHFVEIFSVEEQYKGIVSCLRAAIEGGNDEEMLEELFTTYRYKYDLRYREYNSIGAGADGTFTVLTYNRWNIYSTEEGYLLTNDYDYVSLNSADGICVVTGEDSRIMGPDNMVLGIFKKNVTHAGLMGDGLIPVSFGGTYSYYDEFAVEQFGGYQTAGTFQDGMAAVEKDGKWMLVDTAGKSSSETFQEICLNEAGMYSVNGRFIARQNNKYGIYNKDLECTATLACSDVDVLTQDGLIAVCVDGKWGFMNLEGETVIKPKYEAAKSFSNGLAAVCEDGLWGFIDTDGQLVIDCQFADAGYMSSQGLCPVRVDTEEQDSSEPEQAPDEALTQEDSTESAAAEEPLEKWQFLRLIVGIQEDLK